MFFPIKRNLINSMVSNRFFSNKLEILPEDTNNGKTLLKNKSNTGTNRFFQNSDNNNLRKKGKQKSENQKPNESEDMTSNSLEKIWDIRQLKKEHSIELDRFEDFSRIDFDESENELENKKSENLQDKANKRKTRSFGGKIENRMCTSQPL